MHVPVRAILLLAAIALASSAAAAFAAPPVTETIPIDFTIVLPAGSEDNPCPFDVTFHNQGTVLLTTYLDSTGTPVRQLVRSGHFLETYSANGKQISSHSPSVEHVDLTTNTEVITGNQRHFIVPGVGIVYAQAGRFVKDLSDGSLISVSGLNTLPGAEICAALAP
jgi:hypothetical protein